MNSTKKFKTPVVIGTRGSELALWQARFTQQQLALHGIDSILKIIKTKGDLTHHLSFDKIEGKGFFTKEIEDALLAHEIDLAVHSCKDMPTENTAGLILAAYSKRANPCDILIISPTALDNSNLLSLRNNAVVATSSARRKNQLKTLRPDINFVDIRGNVPTRIQKLKDGIADAIVLAAAGIERLEIDLGDLIRVDLKPPMFIPAPAQGILAFQIREDDNEMLEISSILNEPESFAIANVERKILNFFGGGCQVPIGVYSEVIEDKFHVWLSYAQGYDTPTIRKYLKYNNDVEINATDINNIKNLAPKSVFISRGLRIEGYFEYALAAIGYNLSGTSFIQFSKVAIEDIWKNAEVLFFSSKNGFKYFVENFEDKNLLADKKIAAINEGTAQYIKSIGFEVDFCGIGGDMEKIALDFEEYAKSKTVAFLQAKDSLRTIQIHCKNLEIIEVVVYANTPKTDVTKREEEILIFTSPMNVSAYFSIYEVSENQKVIAIGKSTEQALTKYNISCVTAYSPTPWGLVDAVMGL